jgi:putative membrane protein
MENRQISFLLLLLFFSFACNRATDPQNSETSTNMMTENEGRSTPTELNSETAVDDDALTFMKKAASAGTMEVELGNLAREKAVNPRVKNFGEMMVRDHSTANKALLQIGAQKAVQINVAMNREHKQMVDSMKKLNGTQFDQHYIGMMVKDHAKDIQEFEQAADNRDPEVNRFATKTLPVLRKHLDSAKAIQASLSKK